MIWAHDIIYGVGMIRISIQTFQAGTTFMTKITLDLIKIGLIGYVGYKTYSTNGEWLQAKIQYFKNFSLSFIQ